MNHARRLLVWLSRIHCCRGFGIQSPTDYAFVRYVINEHWPYYAYQQLPSSDWLSRKLGCLYFRLANWRQPSMMMHNDYEAYIHAGSQRTVFVHEVDRVELEILPLKGNHREKLARIYEKADERSIVVVEDIWRDPVFWREIVADNRAVITFDLYYCGIILFDSKRHKQNYKINF